MLHFKENHTSNYLVRPKKKNQCAKKIPNRQIYYNNKNFENNEKKSRWQFLSLSHQPSNFEPTHISSAGTVQLHPKVIKSNHTYQFAKYQTIKSLAN